MRLCILAETYPSTTQTFVYESVEWLRGAGHEVAVVTEHRGDPPGAEAARFPARLVPPWLGWGKKLARLGIDPLRAAGAVRSARRWTGKSGWTASEIAARALLEPLRQAEFILAHFGPLASRWLPVAGVARRPFAVFFHGYDATADLRKRPSLYAGLIRAGVAGITNSEYIRQCLVRAAGYPGDRIGVVPMGVSSELFAEAGRPELTSRRILTIARLVPKKGLSDSLRAFAQALPMLGDDWRYQIVGDGPLMAELQALAGSLGLADRVEFSGYLSRADTLAALRNASVFVLASRTAPSGDTEGTPISILEAACVGLPVVSTLHAGIPETLPAEAAAEGWLVPEGAVDRLAAALERLGTIEARRDWGDRARARVRSRHSPAAHTEATLEALERLARIPTAPHPRPAARAAG